MEKIKTYGPYSFDGKNVTAYTQEMPTLQKYDTNYSFDDCLADWKLTKIVCEVNPNHLEKMRLLCEEKQNDTIDWFGICNIEISYISHELEIHKLCKGCGNTKNQTSGNFFYCCSDVNYVIFICHLKSEGFVKEINDDNQTKLAGEIISAVKNHKS